VAVVKWRLHGHLLHPHADGVPDECGAIPRTAGAALGAVSELREIRERTATPV
jgi:hypothetical protein